MKISVTHALLAAPVFSIVQANTTSTASAFPSRVSTVYQFPNRTWLENIDQRRTGEILTTELHHPRLWQVDPRKPKNQAPVLVANIQEKSALLGITEIASDVFAVNAGSFGDAGDIIPASFTIFKVDFNKKPVRYSKIADVPEAKLLNGLTFVPGSTQKAYPKGLLLSTDTILGAVWSVDLATLEVAIWSQDYLMRPCAPDNLGVNGIKFNPLNHRVYFTNTPCEGGYLASLPLDTKTGKPAGAATIVGGKSQSIFPDDFDLDPKENKAYASAAANHQIDVVDLRTGQATVIAGIVNSSLISQPTAVKIGRTDRDIRQGLLYVSTAGMVGDQVYPGQVLTVQK